MKRVLVTGAHGFLGRHTAAHFKKHGYEVIGIGHGFWKKENPENFGIDQWIEADVAIRSLAKITKKIDCVVHCAGGSSVGYSVAVPMLEFQKTVTSTINVLEYIRISQPAAKLIVPSSAAVYGEKEDEPIQELDSLKPVSPYGFYKKITEELCEAYAGNFNLSIVVIRFFSIYGNGLRKQLLWDACTKLSSNSRKVIFYGTGEETRDWLHVEDAVALIYLMSQVSDRYTIVNGGGGRRETVLDILVQIKKLLGTRSEIVMNGNRKEGDPLHYWADIAKLQHYGWRPQKNIGNGLEEYVNWFQEDKKNTDLLAPVNGNE